MKKYDKYKPSGIDWLGCVPEHWKIVRIKDFCNITRGRVISQLDLEDEGYPVYSSQTAENGCLGYISTYDFEGEAITWTTDGAKAGTVFLRNGKYNCTNVCGILQLKSSVKDTDIKFVAHSLGFIALHNKRLDINGYKIMSNEMAFIVIALPPLTEQTAIAAYLDERTANIDRRIELLKQKIDKYKELRRSLISQVVTRGLNPNVKFKDSGIDWLGQIPEHWETKRIKDLFRSDKGLSITKEDLVEKGLPVISYGQIHAKINNGTTIVDELIRYVPESFKEGNEKSLAHKGNFLFADTSEDTEGCGNCVYVDRETAVYAGYHTLLLRPISELANNKYIAFLFKSDEWRKQIRSVVNGVKLFSVTLKILNFRGVVLPPKDEQDDIAKYLDEKTLQIDTIVKKCEEQIEQLTALRRSLIAEVVTGKIKVTNE